MHRKDNIYSSSNSNEILNSDDELNRRGKWTEQEYAYANAIIQCTQFLYFAIHLIDSI